MQSSHFVMTIEEALKLKIERQVKYYDSSTTPPLASSTLSSQTGPNYSKVEVALQTVSLIFIFVLLLITLKCVYNYHIKKKPANTFPVTLRKAVDLEFKTTSHTHQEPDSISVIM